MIFPVHCISWKQSGAKGSVCCALAMVACWLTTELHKKNHTYLEANHKSCEWNVNESADTRKSTAALLSNQPFIKPITMTNLCPTVVYDIDVLISGHNFTVLIYLHLDQLWSSILINVYCKYNLLWWDLRDALIYGYNDETIIPHPFDWLIITGFPLTSITNLAPDFWNMRK